MIQQVNNSSVRFSEIHTSDIDYLKKYYHDNGKFPMFKQVLIETRTDCNNHCPFCPHAFNGSVTQRLSINFVIYILTEE